MHLDTPKVTLTIAGSDSCAGAGIQADLKSIAANGGYGCSVITAVTAQNTQGVSHIHPVPAKIVRAQIDAVFNDMTVSAVKIGMLANQEIANVVVDALIHHQAQNVVCDPVMLSTSGRQLLSDEAIHFCREHLFPLCTLVTPNYPEYQTLTAGKGRLTHMSLLKESQRLGSEWLLVKGGHVTHTDCADDWLVESGKAVTVFSSPRIATQNAHGTGCTLSSAIATLLAQGSGVPEATEQAKSYLCESLEKAQHWALGKGHGPLNHFWLLNR